MQEEFSENEKQILQALKELGGSATVRQLNAYLWDNRERFQRRGRNWSEHFTEHDLHYLKKAGTLWLVENPHNHFTWYLSPEELWKD